MRPTRSGCTRSATCSSICRATVARRDRSRSSSPGESATVVGAGPHDRLAAGAAAGDASARRGDRRRRDRRDEGHVLQPAVARAELSGGDPARAAREVRGAQPVPRPGSRAGPPRRPPGRDAVAHYPATDGLSSTQILALVADARRQRSATRSSRCRAAAVRERLPDRAGALSAAHFPDVDQRRSSWAAAGWRSRSCCSFSSRCCAGAGCDAASPSRRCSTASAS